MSQISQELDSEAQQYHWPEEQRREETRAAYAAQLGAESEFTELRAPPKCVGMLAPCWGEQGHGVFSTCFVLYGDFTLGEIRQERWRDHFFPAEHGLPVVGGPREGQSYVR